MEYSSLTETEAVRDISSDPFGPPRTAGHSPRRVHAVRVSDGQVIHPYEPHPDDVRQSDEDWMSLHPMSRCKECATVLGVEGYL
jgi:hypothetical protein